MQPGPGLKISITNFSAEGMFVNGWETTHIVLKLIILLFLTQVQVIP